MKTRLAMAGIVFLLADVTLFPRSSRAQPPAAPEYGPATGTLFIVGGNMQDSSGLPQKFIELAGGPSKKFVIIPTNGGNRNQDGTLRVYEEAKVVAEWKKRGLTRVVMLHTHDPKVADTEDFVKPLLDADAVWFDGGRQWNAADSYMNTRTLAELRNVLGHGGIIGGTSAGATIQGEYLVRGDTSGPDVMMTAEPNHQRGFAFLRRSAIDQHINSRNGWDDLIPVMKKFPDYLGLGLSEDTAIIVRGDRFEVFGRFKVAVHDPQRAHQPWEKPYFVLSHGDVYDMKSRRVEAYSLGTPPRAVATPTPAR
jgi:cyanophycinase